MAFSAEIIKVAPVYTTGVVIQWNVTDPPEVGAYNYVIERAGSPGGDWEVLATLTDTLIFTDTSASLDGLTRDIYYRIQVVPPANPAVYTPAHNIRGELPLGIAGRHFLRARKMRSDLLRTFQKFAGREFYVLKRKHWGARCPSCWDSLTKTLLEDNCSACFGVGFSGGYYDAFPIWGRLDPAPTNAPVQMEGKSDQRMFKFTCLDIPVLMPDDVIAGKEDDRRYVVHTQSQTEMRLVGVHQDVSIAELPRDHPSYSVVI